MRISSLRGISMANGIYIGRFQPFHKGHMDVVKFIDSEEDISHILICIGSIQYDHKNKNPYERWSKNPFTLEERKEMIEKSLNGRITTSYSFHDIPDFHDYDKWYDHIKENVPEFNVLYTVSKTEKEYFENKGIEVREFPVVYDFHATVLRKKMSEGKNYMYALTDGSIEVCDRIGAEDRIKDLYEQDNLEKIIADLRAG